MNDSLAAAVDDFLAHKRALGRKYLTEEATLRLLARLRRRARHRRPARADRAAAGRLRRFAPEAPGPQLQPPRRRPRLLSRLGCRPGTPRRPRRCGGSAGGRPTSACRSSSTSFRPAGCSTPPPPCPTTRGAGPRSATHHAIFALCYGLGLRAGEACGLRIGDVDIDRELLVVRGGKFGKSRLVPHGPRIGELLATTTRAPTGSTGQDPLFSFDGQRCVNPAPQARSSIASSLDLGFPVPDGVAPPRLHSLRHSFAVGCLLRWYRAGPRPGQPALPALDVHGARQPALDRRLPAGSRRSCSPKAPARFEAFAEPVWSEATP